MDIAVYTGRPADIAGRLENEGACYDLLDKLAIPYTRIDHVPAETMEVCRQLEGHLGVEICKNLFLCNRQKTDFYLLLMEGDKPFKTKYLSAILGCSRLSFAEPEHLAQYLGVTPGSASVLGLRWDTEKRVRLVIDRPVAEKEWFGCHPCINTSSLRLRTADVLEKLLPALGYAPTVVDLPVEEAQA